MSTNRVTKRYVPKRGDIVLLDFEPTRGKEIGKLRPALILSSEAHNRQSSLLICCPISTSVRGVITEVPIDNLKDKRSVVAASIIQTLSWKARKVKFITKAKPGIINKVLFRLIPLIGADRMIEKLVTEK